MKVFSALALVGTLCFDYVEQSDQQTDRNMAISTIRRLYRLFYVLLSTVGLTTYFSMLAFGARYWLSIHAGVRVLLINLAVCPAGTLITRNHQIASDS